MNLLDVRKKFVELSGRYDLVWNTTDWADRGANFYINEGQDWLNRQVSAIDNTATIYEGVEIGEYKLNFQHHCRVVKNVYVESDEGRVRLEKVSLQELKEYYTNPMSDVDNGTPTVYALADLRALETTDKDSLGVYLDNTFTEDDLNYDYRGIIFMPPVDKASVVSVSGLFSQFKLTANDDENYWTLEVPGLLIKAALYQLEVFSRGTENTKNWLSAIALEIEALEKDIADEESTEVDQFNG